MAKVALLIGVSDYTSALSPLPCANRDAEAIRSVLQSPDIGKFDDVKLINDPDPQSMRESIEALFAGRKKDDLVLLFFSGHGVKDDSGRLYLATSRTAKTERNELVKSTAVAATFVHECIKSSRSKRKVIMLDCCFSGAFAADLSAKDDGTVDINSQLGGEGCAVLTSSTSTQYSYEQKGEELSVYTRYLLEGMETGAADLNSDGYISIAELHEYAEAKVHEESPSMNPKIYALEEGYSIRLLEAVAPSPLLKYQRAVEKCAAAGGISESGEISGTWRAALDEGRIKLQITAAEADVLETRVLHPFREYRKKLKRYESAFKNALQAGFPIPSSEKKGLKQFQRTLSLRDEDVASIEERLNNQVGSQKFQTSIPSQSSKVTPSSTIRSPESTKQGSPKDAEAIVLPQQDPPLSEHSFQSPRTKGDSNRLWIGIGLTALAVAGFVGGSLVVLMRSPAERSIADVLYESPDLLTPEECQQLSAAYDAREGEVINALSNNPAITAHGAACTALGVTITPIEVPPITIVDLMAKTSESLTSEDCTMISDAYSAEDPVAIANLGDDPIDTAVGQACLAWGVEITPLEKEPPPPPPEPRSPKARSLESILYGPIEITTLEECTIVANAYTNGNPEAVRVISQVPTDSGLRKRCDDLGEIIPSIDYEKTSRVCVQASSNLRLYISPGGVNSEVIVVPGEEVDKLSSNPEMGQFGSQEIPFIEIKKDDGSSGWIPERRTQICP